MTRAAFRSQRGWRSRCRAGSGFRFVAVAGIVVGTGCGSGSPTGPDPIVGPPPTTTPAASLTAVRVDGSASVAEGGTVQLRAMASYSDGSSREVSAQATWSSSRPSVASVSASGLVTAATLGTTDVSATYQGQTGRQSLSVGAAEWDVRIDLASFTAVDSCDDFTQGLDSMEVAYKVAVVLANGQQTVLTDTGHPGNPSGGSLNGAVRLREGQVVSLRPEPHVPPGGHERAIGTGRVPRDGVGRAGGADPALGAVGA